MGKAARNRQNRQVKNARKVAQGRARRQAAVDSIYDSMPVFRDDYLDAIDAALEAGSTSALITYFHDNFLGQVQVNLMTFRRTDDRTVEVKNNLADRQGNHIGEVTCRVMKTGDGAYMSEGLFNGEVIATAGAMPTRFTLNAHSLMILNGDIVAGTAIMLNDMSNNNGLRYRYAN